MDVPLQRPPLILLLTFTDISLGGELLDIAKIASYLLLVVQIHVTFKFSIEVIVTPNEQSRRIRRNSFLNGKIYTLAGRLMSTFIGNIADLTT
jgi:hypothetical protein